MTLPDRGEVCFGRADLLDRILQRALDLKAGYRQNLAVVGPWRIGKSTILQCSAEQLKQHPPLLPVYLELRPGITVPQFIEQFASTLLYRYWATHGHEAPRTFEALVQRARPYVPRTTDLLVKAVATARRRRAAALALLFQAPGELRRESGRLCLIMLDEFHRLAAWGAGGSARDPWQALGQQIVVQQDTMYLLASSEVEEARRILRERLALLFGHFEVIPVGPFDLATSVRFLSDHAGLAALGPSVLTTLADLTEGYPFALECVARAVKAVDPAAEGDPAATACAALEQVICRPAGALAQQCQEAVARIPARRREHVFPVLLAAADGHHRLGALAKATGTSAAEVRRAVRTLGEAGLLVRHGAFSSVSGRLLRLWLKTVGRAHHGPVQAEASAVGQALSAAVREWMQQATPRPAQAVLELVAELLGRFHHELIEWHGRRVRLPALDVHTLLLPGIPRAVVGQQQDALWICVPYPAVIRESDAVTLIQTLRSVNKPWGRRIVIALDGLELNARLLLQEQRCWVWELEDLNRFLELYGLPRLLPTGLQAPAAVAPVPAEPPHEGSGEIRALGASS